MIEMVTNRVGPIKKAEDLLRFSFTYLIQGALMGFILVSQLLLTPFLYVITFSFKLLSYFIKTVSIIFTLIFSGVDGVRKNITKHYLANQIYYAVLKGNGQYLKLGEQPLEAVLICQLYDYTIRKFMTLSTIQSDLKVAEIEFSTTKGLKFLHDERGIKSVTGLSTNPKKVLKAKEETDKVHFISTKYSPEEQLEENIDVFLILNSLKEPKPEKNYVDLMKVLGFINKNISKNGYVVFGRYFDSEGENAVFEELFSSLGFRIDLQDNITPNIEHADKMLKKIHKNRKIPWAFFRLKEMMGEFMEQENPIAKIVKGLWTVMKRLAGRINTDPRFYVYILQKK